MLRHTDRENPCPLASLLTPYLTRSTTGPAPVAMSLKAACSAHISGLWPTGTVTDCPSKLPRCLVLTPALVARAGDNVLLPPSPTVPTCCNLPGRRGTSRSCSFPAGYVHCSPYGPGTTPWQVSQLLPSHLSGSSALCKCRKSKAGSRQQPLGVRRCWARRRECAGVAHTRGAATCEPTRCRSRSAREHAHAACSGKGMLRCL